MPTAGTISLSLATIPGVGDRLLHDGGFDAQPKLVEKHDPQVPRWAISARLLTNA
jgi:hypothetical protein